MEVTEVLEERRDGDMVCLPKSTTPTPGLQQTVLYLLVWCVVLVWRGMLALFVLARLHGLPVAAGSGEPVKEGSQPLTYC